MVIQMALVKPNGLHKKTKSHESRKETGKEEKGVDSSERKIKEDGRKKAMHVLYTLFEAVKELTY